MFSFVSRHKIISAIICTNIIVIAATVIAIIIHYSQTATVDINVAPINATVSMNGKVYDNQASHDVFPGNYHVEIAMDGMQTKEYDVTLENHSLTHIWEYLLDSNGGFDYYLTHPVDFESLTQIAATDDIKAQEFIKQYTKIHALDAQLPIEYSNTHDQDATELISLYIDYGEEKQCGDENELCLVVWDYTGQNTDLALSLIRDAGFNPDDYKIIFLNKDDPRWE